jgi:ABC-type multidrug transport system fused ATPase/permease subunit
VDDDRDDIKPPENWREYMRTSAESLGIFRLVWREFLAAESKVWGRRMLVLLTVGTAFGMLQPWCLRYIFDGLTEHKHTLVLWGLSAVFVTMIGQRVADHFAMKAREWVFGANIGQLDERASELFFEKSVGQHIQESSLLTIGNMEKGRGAVVQLTNMLIFEGLPSLFQLAISFLLILVLSPIAALLMTFLLSSYIIWAIFINQRVMMVCTPLDKEFRRINRHRVERWDKIERVKTSGKEAEEVREMRGWFDEVIAKDRKFWFWVIDVIFLRAIAKYLAVIAVMAYGALRVWTGEWTIGTLYPLYVWTTYVGDNIWRLGQIEHQLNWNLPAVRSMVKALMMPPDIVDRPNAIVLPPNVPVSIRFHNVSHSYPHAKTGEAKNKPPLPVLANVGFEIRPGEKVALLGPSGVGKTTVMRLIQRHMDPTAGAILVNGTDLRDIRISSWTSHLGYIPQQAQVFDGTIRYNLIYGLSKTEREKVTDEELWDVMRRLQIDFGERLTDGLDTVVGRNGVKLSGGQAQRLMIGAAVLKKPRLLVIDEATSSLDSTTEKAVQEGLASILTPDVSALIVTHRLSTVRRLCSKFIVLSSTGVSQNGDSQIDAIASSFEELYELSSTFRQLADDQGVVIHSRPEV